MMTQYSTRAMVNPERKQVVTEEFKGSRNADSNPLGTVSKPFKINNRKITIKFDRVVRYRHFVVRTQCKLRNPLIFNSIL